MATDRPSFLQIGSAVGGAAGHPRRRADRAIAAGLTFRPPAVPAKGALVRHNTRPETERLRTLSGGLDGVGVKREAEVLAAWRAYRS